MWVTVPAPDDGHVSRFTVDASHGRGDPWKRYSLHWSDAEHRLYACHTIELGAEVAEALHGLHGENQIGLVNAGHRANVVYYRHRCEGTRPAQPAQATLF